MTALILIPIFFLSPSYCPPKLAQIHWTSVKHRLAGQGIVIRGVIFDRDRNRRVSNGDIMRIDEATRRGKQINISEPWLKLTGSLTTQVRRSVRRNRHVKAVCVGRISVRGVARIHSAKALGKRLRNGSEPTRSQRRAAAKSVMQEKVNRVCKNSRNFEVNELSSLLG